MRLDIFLKLSRLCPRRTVAQQLCDAGFVLVDGRVAKPSHAIKAGNEITIRRRDRELVVRVTKVPATRNLARRNAASLIEIVSDRVMSEG